MYICIPHDICLNLYKQCLHSVITHILVNYKLLYVRFTIGYYNNHIHVKGLHWPVNTVTTTSTSKKVNSTKHWQRLYRLTRRCYWLHYGKCNMIVSLYVGAPLNHRSAPLNIKKTTTRFWHRAVNQTSKSGKNEEARLYHFSLYCALVVNITKQFCIL